MKRDPDVVFEEMIRVATMSENERWTCKMLPLGRHVYNGYGYILPNKAYWTECLMNEMEEWSKDYDIKFDGPVVVFQDEATIVLFKLRWC
jgi:hypothetical protein